MVNGRLDNIYDDVDMRASYNNGFWQGASLATVILGIIVLGSLYAIGYYF